MTGKTVVQPLALEVRLLSAVSSMDTAGAELTGSAYVRKAITFGNAADVGSGVIRASSNVAVNWASLDASSTKNIYGIEIWDSAHNVRLAWYNFAAPVAITAGSPYNNAIGDFSVTWLTTGTDGGVCFDKAMRIKMIDWLLSKAVTQPVLPLQIHPVNADGSAAANATPHAGNLWTEQDITFDGASYAASKVSTPNSFVVQFDGLDSASALAIPAFEIWDNAGPDVRIAYMPVANHPVVTPPTIPAGNGFQLAAGAVKLKIV